MKKLFLGVFCLAVVVSFSVTSFRTSAQEKNLVSPNIVISQFQPGTAANANDEFIELHNIGAAPVDLNGYRLVYRSQNGTNDVGPLKEWTTTTILQPGQYYLIGTEFYSGSVTLDASYTTSVCSCSLSAANGGLAVRQGAQNTGAIIDAVGWGSGSNIFVEGTRTTAPGSGNSKARLQAGCQDTDSNSADFSTLSPFAPRNSATAPFACSGGGTTLFAAINANPNQVAPGGNTLLTVTVIPATTPPSTGVTVAGDLTNIGGSATQVFFDNGTNGDVTAGDNVYSFLATIPIGATGGLKSVTAVAADAEARTVNLNVNITINAPLPGEDPILLGNPSNATADILNENNYLMQKPQYTLSYNRSKATSNWTAWRLDSNWIGSSGRQDDFRPDTSLPQGWYQVTDQDYSGSGYDRGHLCPSGDRTNSIPNNSATFLMTNMLPQISDNNQGPWEEFESYCRTLAGQGKEIYIMSGPLGSLGTIAQGRVTVPQYTWKVVLVLPNGDNDLSRVNKGTRAFGIIVPNFPPVNREAPWRNFRVHVDAVENLTGLNFFSNVGANTQAVMEKRRDRE